MARRISLPAPEPRISGITPAQNAIDVIKIGRKRRAQASFTASYAEWPASSNSLANSTIKIAFLQAKPTNTTNATWVKIFKSPGCMKGGNCEIHTPKSADRIHMGTIMMMASGRLQLSYCAASTKITKMTDSSSTAAKVGSLIVVPGKVVSRVKRSW